MKIALVRGPSLNEWELQNWLPLAKKHQLLLVGSTSTKLKARGAMLARPICVGEWISKLPFGYFLVNSLLGDPRMIWRLGSVIEDCDVVVCAETRSYYSLQAVMAKQKGLVKKVAVTVWENIPFLGDDNPKVKSIKQQVKDGADLFLAVTGKARDALIAEGVAEKKIKLVPMGVDQTKFKILNLKFKIEDKIKILSVGRLVPEKGFEDLIKACAILVKDKDLKNKFTVTLVGEGPQERRLKDVVLNKGLSSIISFKKASYSQMPKIYQNHDIFVLASRQTSGWQEQYGVVLAEASSCGLPIVASKSGSIPEVTEKAAFYFEPGNFRQLSVLLKKLIVNGNLRKRRKLEAYELSRKKFNANKVSRILEATLDDLVKQYSS